MAKETAKERSARMAAERAAYRQAQKKAEKRRNVLMAAGVVLAMVVIVGGGFLLSRGTDDSPKDSEAAAAAGSLKIGPDDAPHRVVIYEDFLCPYCAQMEVATSEQLTALAAEGKVQVEYRPFRLLDTEYSQDSLEVFQALVHADTTEVAKKFHDLAFADQPSETGAAPSLDDLVDLAVQAGADETGLRAALDGDAKKWADEATQAAADAGVNSTPTILLDGSHFLAGSTVEERAAALIEAVS